MGHSYNSVECASKTRLKFLFKFRGCHFWAYNTIRTFGLVPKPQRNTFDTNPRLGSKFGTMEQTHFGREQLSIAEGGFEPYQPRLESYSFQLVEKVWLELWRCGTAPRAYSGRFVPLKGRGVVFFPSSSFSSFVLIPFARWRLLLLLLLPLSNFCIIPYSLHYFFSFKVFQKNEPQAGAFFYCSNQNHMANAQKIKALDPCLPFVLVKTH